MWRHSETSGRKEKVGDLSKKGWNEQELYQTTAKPVIPIITGMTEDACLLWELAFEWSPPASLKAYSRDKHHHHFIVLKESR